MKNWKQANKGQSLEQFIRFANHQYMREGIAVINKQATEFLPIRNGYGQVVSCKVVSKATVDFLGRIGSIPIAAEAKECKDVIRFDRVEDHQAKFLDAYQGDGEAICIVVVSFSLNTFYAVPWPFWKAARDAWQDAQWSKKKKAEKLTVCFAGQTWITPGKASVKESELLPEWKITTGGRYGLDYLKRYRHETDTRTTIIH